MKCSLGISNFLEEISSLSHSVLFLYFFALIAEEGFFSLLAILWNSAFRCLYLSFSPLLFSSLLFTAIFKPSSDSHFAFLHFFSMGMVLVPVSCTMSRSSIHSSSGTLPIRSTRGHHQMVNTKIRLIIFYVAKDGEALYSQQKQDQELTVAQIMNSLLPNSDLNWRKWGKPLDHSDMT